MTDAPGFLFENTYAEQLEGLYASWTGAQVPAPEVALLNRPLGGELGWEPDAVPGCTLAGFLTGAKVTPDSRPLAMAYSGHQFGGFSPQLGDGRALLLGEVIDLKGKRRDLHLKGSGRTPFSRGGDGKATIGPMLREYVVSEAMHALGVPTTRALAVCLTGEDILRQNGPERGAVLTRVAASHLRVGSFQFAAARGELDLLRRLANYTISRHDPEISNHPNRYLLLLERVIARQARLVAHWMSLGFVHGVMNTDNMALSGETIDYGPCAFIDRFSTGALFSSIDRGGRYAFRNQPGVAQWNLARFAESLLELIDPADSDKAIAAASEVLATFTGYYHDAFHARICAKTGLSPTPENKEVSAGLFDALSDQSVDFTQFFQMLAREVVSPDTYFITNFSDPDRLTSWLLTWRAALEREGRGRSVVVAEMQRENPIYIPRNHLVEEVLSAAEAGDFDPAKAFLDVLSQPFTARNGLEKYAEPGPEDAAPYRTFCGT